jgi:glutamate/tyrosine decarboxylase-like PLP-dependent enzyme
VFAPLRARAHRLVTIDPHKLGFVPYPAGAISFRDRRVRDLVAVEAPYLFHPGAPEHAYIGRFIFEGSKPGAAAAGVWMSHKVLPLDATRLRPADRRDGARRAALHRRLAGGDWAPFRVVMLPRPDLNIVCFAVGHPSCARSRRPTSSATGSTAP